MGIWEQAAELIAAGKTVRVTVPSSAEVRHAPAPQGHPRVRDLGNPHIHYATPSRGSSRPRCLVCRTRLRKDDVEVCSEPCKAQAVAYLSAKLARLKGTALRVPLSRTAARELEDACAQ